MNRFVVKSEYATITIPEIQLTIPKHTQKGSIKTIEGYISATIDGLKMHQEERRLSDLETAIKLDEYIERLQRMCEGSQMPFHFIIDDPSGNSYVQNPHAPARDVYVSTKHYLRTQKDLADIGFADEEEIKQSELKYKSEEQERKPYYLEHKFVKECQFTAEEVDNMILLASKWTEVKKEHEEVKEVFSAGFDYTKSIDQQSHDIGNINNEAFVIPLECYQCGEIGVQKTCVSNIPHFKEIIIMAFNCDSCEFRSVEVKQGGGISEKGRKVTLSVKNIEDLKRDLYKGDDCSVEIPEVDLQLAPGSLGGIYKSFICWNRFFNAHFFKYIFYF